MLRFQPFQVLLGLALLFNSASNPVLGSPVMENCVEHPPGLVSWWPGDGNADDIINANDGTLQNGATFAAGKVRQAFSFDGMNDYVRVPTSSTLNLSGSFSIDAWIFPTSDRSAIIVTKWGDTGEWSNQRSYSFITQPGLILGFGISDAAHQPDHSFHAFYTPPGAIMLGAWNHVAAVYDQTTGTRKIFVNGLQVAVRTDPPITVLTSIADVAIGAWISSPTTVQLPFAGLIDEVEIYNRALSTEEIRSIFNAGSTVRNIYFNDFEGAIGPEWSNILTDTTPLGTRKFLGQFGNQTVSLTLDNLPPHTVVSVSFDLFMIRTWDGNTITWRGGPVGPDVWDLSVDGISVPLLHTTFTNWNTLGFRQAYPGIYPGGNYPARTGTAENNTLGYTDAVGEPMDSVYHLHFTFPHSASSLVLIFSASGLQVLADESWGVDNTSVSVGYSISGCVINANKASIPGVTVSAGSIANTTTDSSGCYTLMLGTGTYTLTPSRSGYTFSPSRRVGVKVPPNKMGQDFTGVSYGGPPTPFLDLPFSYGDTVANFVKALQVAADGGRVNCWFDHKYPDYGEDNGTGIWIYNGKYTDERDKSWEGKVLCYGKYCYDGHDGIDFTYKDPHPGEPGNHDLPILSAANGVVTATHSTCPNKPDASCGGGYGNYVILYHSVDDGNGYFTRYAHLAAISDTITPGIAVTSAYTLGIMGNSGDSSGTHLHFGVYRDNGNAQWNGKSIDKPVDPFEWQLRVGGVDVPDPWVTEPNRQGPTSYRLWKYDPATKNTFLASQGATMTDTTKTVIANIPPNTFSGQVTLELSPGPVAGAPAQLRSSGHSFWLRLLEWLPGGSSLQGVATLQSTNQFTITQPITLTVNYTDTDVLHLDATQLVLNLWDEDLGTWQPLSTTVNLTDHMATAQALSLGDFDLQAPLLCPADNLEPDDNYYAARPISADGTSVGRLFDIAQDEDWFRLETIAGAEYTIRTSALSAGVDTVVRLYDQDGITMLASDDNSGGGTASLLVWQAPLSGTYFIRVAPVPGSTYGCSASYSVSATQKLRLYLPRILKNVAY